MIFYVYSPDDELLGDVDMPFGLVDSDKIEGLKQHAFLPQNDDVDYELEYHFSNGESYIDVLDEDGEVVLFIDADLDEVGGYGIEHDTEDEDEDDSED
jgi:hypothetical protein